MLTKSQARYKFIPNLHGIMAGSPVMYEAYQSIGTIYGKSSMNVLERQIVLQSINFENECHYCMAAHSLIANGEKMPPEILSALREGRPLANEKLEVLRRFAATMTRERGWASQEDVQAFLGAGYTQENLLEVIVAIAYKVMSNYINHLAETPLDDAFRPYVWQHPGKRTTASD